MNLTIDTFAWLELIRDTPAAGNIRAAMMDAEETFTPSIVLAEVAGSCHRAAMSDELVAMELNAIREGSIVIPIDAAIAIAGAHALDELRSRARERRNPLPGLADALILATARALESRLLTGDPHFEGFPETVWIP